MSDTPPAAGADGPDQLTMPLFAEELVVSRRRVDTVVRVSRETIATERQVEEDLANHAVIVERVAIGRAVEAVPPIREEGGTIVFPVVEEEVVVTRRLILKEEVRVSRVSEPGRHVEIVSLREQQVSVTRTPAETRASAPEIDSNTIRKSIMTEETIVAVFDTEAHAEAAIQDLRAANIPESAITRRAGSVGATDTATVSGYSPRQPVEERGFWSNLFGGEPEYDTAVYDRSIASGSTVVTVRAAELDYERVVEILEAHHPIDIDERAAGYGLTHSGSGHAGYSETAAMPYGSPTGAAPLTGTVAPAGTLHGATVPGMHDESDALQLAEEQITVGKRVLNRGGTRIRRYVVETPVEEQVRLRDEKVMVERRPVTDGRTVSDADFSDRTIEMTESTEEAVVSKTARVVEEVALRKQATDRVETVRDNVRRQKVEIEQVPGTAGVAAAPTPRI